MFGYLDSVCLLTLLLPGRNVISTGNFWISAGLYLFLLFRASDLVMKVDALLSAQPKGEARIEYHFFEERYRYRIAEQCFSVSFNFPIVPCCI